MLPITIQKTIKCSKIITWILGILVIFCFWWDLKGGTFFYTPLSILWLCIRYVTLKYLIKGRKWAWLASIVISCSDLMSLFFPFAIISLVGLLQKPSLNFYLKEACNE